MKPARLFLLFAAMAFASQRGTIDPPDVKLPDGRSQREAILKAEHKKSLDDVAEILRMAGELKAELEKNEQWVVSMKSIKQTEEIEKLAKRVRGWLKR